MQGGKLGRLEKGGVCAAFQNEVRNIMLLVWKGGGGGLQIQFGQGMEDITASKGNANSRWTGEAHEVKLSIQNEGGIGL